MKNKNLATSIIIGAIVGATVTFLAVHKPTREKIMKQAKVAHKEALKAIKEQASQLKVD